MGGHATAARECSPARDPSFHVRFESLPYTLRRLKYRFRRRCGRATPTWGFARSTKTAFGFPGCEAAMKVLCFFFTDVDEAVSVCQQPSRRMATSAPCQPTLIVGINARRGAKQKPMRRRVTPTATRPRPNTHTRSKAKENNDWDPDAAGDLNASPPHASRRSGCCFLDETEA